MDWLRQKLDHLLGIWRPGAAVILQPDTSLLSVPGFRPEKFEQGIEILNDSATPMEFVISVLSAHLGLSYRDAVKVMLAIHTRGGALLPMLSMDLAERAAFGIAAEAQGRGYPLICRPVSVTAIVLGES